MGPVEQGKVALGERAMGCWVGHPTCGIRNGVPVLSTVPLGRQGIELLRGRSQDGGQRARRGQRDQCVGVRAGGDWRTTCADAAAYTRAHGNTSGTTRCGMRVFRRGSRSHRRILGGLGRTPDAVIPFRGAGLRQPGGLCHFGGATGSAACCGEDPGYLVPTGESHARREGF